MIKDLKDLQKLFKLCRAQGVMNFKGNGFEFVLGDLPTKNVNGYTQEESGAVTDPYAGFPQGDLTPEQLMFYSAGGKPDEDPLNKDNF